MGDSESRIYEIYGDGKSLNWGYENGSKFGNKTIKNKYLLKELRESVTMVAACSAHPARISQLLLHPHPGMKHQLGAVRIAAVQSPSLSSLMERLKDLNYNS